MAAPIAFTVCSADSAAQCDYSSLQLALFDLVSAQGEFELTLLPGEHPPMNGMPVYTDVVVLFEPGAELSVPTNGFNSFYVGPSGRLELRDAVIDQGDPPGFGGNLAIVNGGALVVDTATVTGVTAAVGAFLSADSGGSVTLLDVVFEDMEVPYALVELSEASLDWVGGIASTTSDYPSAAIVAFGSSTSIDGVTFDVTPGFAADVLSASAGGDVQVVDVTASKAGGGYFTSSLVQADGLAAYSQAGGVFSGGDEALGGALVTLSNIAAVSFDGVSFTPTANWAAIAVDGAQTAAIEGIVVDRTGAGEESPTGVTLDNVPDVTVSGSWFCGGVGLEGGALALGGSCETGCVVEGSVFQGVTAINGAGAISADGGTLVVDHSTFAVNALVSDKTAAVIQTQGQIGVTYSLFVGNQGGSVVVSAESVQVVDRNVFWSNSATALVDFPYDPDDNPTVPVVFVDGAGRCGAAVVPGVGSSSFVVDNGVGALPPDCQGEELVGDGVDSDCDGLERCPEDADGDGYASDQFVDVPLVGADPCGGVVPGDCDDSDDEVSPAATEVWYDDVDQDCAGGDDHDQDADGVPLADDCDDEDPALQECPLRLGGGACATGGPSPTIGFVLLAVAALRRPVRTRRA